MVEQLSRGDLLCIIDVATRCLAAETCGDLSAIISSLGGIVSFDKAALCAVRLREGGISLEHYVNHSYGAWAKVYEREGFERVDPILRHIRTTNGSFRWGDALPAGGPPGPASTFVEAAGDFGLVDGVTYACGTARSPVRTVLSLANSEVRDPARALTILDLVGPHLHEAYGRLLNRGGDGGHVSLSAREREVLSWTQQGKTYWEIGCILGISQRTVKYHFAHIRAKLDAVSASHAVAKAMRMGVIG
jgi:DNA-binding CsgD family transcriptional regulator